MSFVSIIDPSIKKLEAGSKVEVLLEINDELKEEELKETNLSIKSKILDIRISILKKANELADQLQELKH